MQDFFSSKGGVLKLDVGCDAAPPALKSCRGGLFFFFLPQKSCVTFPYTG